MAEAGTLTKRRRSEGRMTMREHRAGKSKSIRRNTGRPMLAAVMAGPESLRVVEVPRTEPGPGMVRIRLEGCGVCASNLPVWEGRPWFHYPLEPGAPGHEGWGMVDAVGSGVHALGIGDRVAFLSGHAYAEYDVIPAESAVPLPIHLDGRPFPGEPLGCAFNIVRRSGIRSGDSVAVVGTGFLGLLVIALAHVVGARVIALSRRTSALETARKFGADSTVLMDDHARVIGEVQAMTGGNGCPVVIETAGYQWPLDLAGELTSVRGRLVVAGYHQDGPRQVNMQLWNWRGLDVINAHERDPLAYIDGIRAAVSAVSAGVFDPGALFTHRYRIGELATAFRDLRDHPDGFVKGLLIFDQTGEDA